MLSELNRLGTVAAVAASMHLTGPGVSMQLAALEREVGLPLTERHGRTLRLTPAGVLLAQHGADLVDRLALAEMEVAALREGSAGTYRVAAFPSIARSVVADTWATLIAQPEIGLRIELLELEPHDSLPALANGDVTLALTHSYSNMAIGDLNGCVVTPIAREQVWLALPSSEGGSPGKEMTLSDYATHDWILPHDRNWACHEMVQRACGLAGFAPRAVAEAVDFGVILSLISAGAGVALVPELTVAHLPDNVTLHPLSVPIYRHDYVVTREATDADPGVRRLRSLFAASASRLVPQTRTKFTQ